MLPYFPGVWQAEEGVAPQLVGLPQLLQVAVVKREEGAGLGEEAEEAVEVEGGRLQLVATVQSQNVSGVTEGTELELK